MKKHRTFLAIPVDPMVEDAAGELTRRLATGAEATNCQVNWVEPGNMHITLKFFGDVRESDLYELSKIAQNVARGFPQFAIQVAGAGAFPKVERARTLWAAVTEGLKTLELLHDAIEESYSAVRYPRERRKFHPHLTLGRMRNRPGGAELATAISENADFDLGESLVDRMILFSSELRKNGPVYTPMATAKLGH